MGERAISAKLSRITNVFKAVFCCPYFAKPLLAVAIIVSLGMPLFDLQYFPSSSVVVRYN